MSGSYYILVTPDGTSIKILVRLHHSSICMYVVVAILEASIIIMMYLEYNRDFRLASSEILYLLGGGLRNGNSLFARISKSNFINQ